MTIDAQCKTCQKRYRVNDSLAGRVAECKHCGSKFRIPYRSAVVRLGDESEAEADSTPARAATAAPAAPRPQAASVRTFEEYAPLVPKPKKSKLDEPTENNVSPMPMPAIVTDLWLPIAIMVACYGVALFVSVSAVLRSYGVGAGFIMIGLVAASLFIVIIPLTVKAIDSASGTFDFKVSNSLWTQSAAIVSVPVMCGTIGLVTGGLTGTLAGTAIGVAVAVPLTMLLLQISIGSGLQAGVLASLFFLLGTGGTVVVIWIVASVLFPIWYLNLPWGDAPAPAANTVVAANVESTPAAPAAAVETPAAPATTNETQIASGTSDPATDAAPVAAPMAPAPDAAAAAPLAQQPVAQQPVAENIFKENAAAPATPAALSSAEVTADAPAVTVATTASPGRPVDELLPPAPTPIADLIAKAPTTAPAATPAVAAQRQWVVTVASVRRPDASSVNQELADTAGLLPHAQSEARAARDRANFLDSQFTAVTEHSPRGFEGDVRVKKQHTHSKAERGKANAAALRAENEVKRLRNRIAQLERDRAELESTLIISGELEDGTLVEIDAGPRDARLAEAMQPGTQWKVEGGGRVVTGVLHVKPRVLQPVKPNLQAAAPEVPRP